MDKQPTLTVPMVQVMLAILKSEHDPYPAGQMRFIMMGLYNRGYVTDDGWLTEKGLARARRLAGSNG